MTFDYNRNQFKLWRYLIDFWSFVYFIFVLLDFFYDNAYSGFLEVLSVVYIGSLAIYTSNKEFERWYDKHTGQHPGEVFVFIWSVLMLVLFFMSLFKNRDYQIPNSVISSYIAVLTILAVTRRSKKIYQHKRAQAARRLAAAKKAQVAKRRRA